jgi:protein-disulfide isomerase
MRRYFGILLGATLTLVGGCLSKPTTIDDVPADAVAYSEGDPKSPVQIVYFDDYVCDDCARFSKAAVTPLQRDWVAKGRARLTIVDLAWHRGSVAGAAAASCAAAQGKFWPMHSALFERQETWKRAVDIPRALEAYAAEFGVDTLKFRRCAAERSHQDRLDRAEELTRRWAVRGTPAFLVNGRLYYGSQQWSWMEKVLLAHERGQPDSAPPPPLAMPTKKVIDEARVRQLEDSLGGSADSVRLLQIRDSLRSIVRPLKP